MKLKKLLFKEMEMPSISFYFILTGFLFIIIGAYCNFIVMETNQGKTPVWSNDVGDSTIHFSITNVSEVNNLQFADMWYFKGSIWSIGDILMIFGLVFLLISIILYLYNFTIHLIIFLNKRKKELKSN